uniref:Zinc finger (CCCH type) motif-containing protein n=1 Tax=Toxoplasma gondii COUG TaxID=1074873 RepID=A0A2G8YCF9_TOXGO|nr:zinc finger (CCCH type) motif-containing protein [Toxoplasma gondii COUG]
MERGVAVPPEGSCAGKITRSSVETGAVERAGGNAPTSPVYEQLAACGAGVTTPVVNAADRLGSERGNYPKCAPCEEEEAKGMGKVALGGSHVSASGAPHADPVPEHTWATGSAVNSSKPGEVSVNALLCASGTSRAMEAVQNGDEEDAYMLASTPGTETGLLSRQSPSACDAMTSFERDRLLEQRRLEAQVLHLQRKVILQEQMLLQQQQAQLAGYAVERGTEDRDPSDAVTALSSNASGSKVGKDDGKARRGRNDVKGGLPGRSHFLGEKSNRGGKGAGPATGPGRSSAALEGANGSRPVFETRSRQDSLHAKSRSGSAGDAELQEYVSVKKQGGSRRSADETFKKEVPGRLGVAGERGSRSQSFSGSTAQDPGDCGGRSLKDAIPVQDSTHRPHDGKRDKEEESEASGFTTPSAGRTLGQGGRVGNRCRAQSDFTDGSFKKKGGRIEDQFFRIKLCPKYMRGLCRKGARCSYAHAEEELRDVPNLWKTKLCTAFRLGKPCPLETSCPYAHGEEELRSTADYYKTKLCKFWMREGRCDAGKACRHAHGNQELRKRNYRHTELEKFALRHHLDMRQLLDEFRTGRVPAAIQELVSTSTTLLGSGGRSHGGAVSFSGQGQPSACENQGRPRFFSFTAACVERKPRSNSRESLKFRITAASGRGSNDEGSRSSRDEIPPTVTGSASETGVSTGKQGGPGHSQAGKYKGMHGGSVTHRGVSPGGCGEMVESEKRGRRGGPHGHFHSAHGQYHGPGRGARQRHGQYRHRFDNHHAHHHLHQAAVAAATADALKGAPVGVPCVAGGASYGLAPGVTPFGSFQQQPYPYALNYTANLAACGGLHAAAAAVAAAAVAQQHQHLEVAAKVAGTPLYQGVNPYLGAPYNSNFPGGGIPYSASVPSAPYTTAGPNSSGTAACASAPFTQTSRPYSPPGGAFSARTPSTTGATPSPQTSYSGHGAVPFSPPCSGTSPRGSPGRDTATPSAVLHTPAAPGTLYPAGAATADIGTGAPAGAGDPGSFASTTQYSQGQLAGATPNAVYSAMPGSSVTPSVDTPGMCHGDSSAPGTEGSDWVNPACGRVTDRLRQTEAMDRASLGSLLSAAGLTMAAGGAGMVDRAGAADHPLAMCALPGVATGASFCQCVTPSGPAPAGLPGNAGAAISPYYVPTSTYPVYPAAATHAAPVARMQPVADVNTAVGRENSVQSE